jgi:hypothetical protein
MIEDDQVATINAVLHNFLYMKHYKMADLLFQKAKHATMSQKMMYIYIDVSKKYANFLPSRKDFIAKCKEELKNRQEPIIKPLKNYL